MMRRTIKTFIKDASTGEKFQFSLRCAVCGSLWKNRPAYFSKAEVQPENKGKTVYFGGIDKAKFKRKVVPGDKLKLECEIIKQKGPVGVGKATATVDGKIAVVGELTFMIG